MNKYTIKSVSDEGTYYLVKNWEKAKTFWKTPAKTLQTDLFTRAQDAKHSLTCLLRVMEEYAEDTLTLIELDNAGNVVKETNI